MRKLVKPFAWLVFGFLCAFVLTIVKVNFVGAQVSSQEQNFQLLAEADRLYLEGNLAGAEELYRQAKDPFVKEGDTGFPDPITDPAQLSGAGSVYWRNAQEGIERGLDTQAAVALDLLLKTQPEFVPAYPLYAQFLQQNDQTEEAIAILEQGSALFPDSPELTRALVETLQDDRQWIEASITARQFAVINETHPDAPEFAAIADETFRRFRRRLNEQILTQGILGTAVGIVTGDRGATAVQLAPLLLQGESGMGSALAAQIRQQQPLITDPVVVEYVSQIGRDTASLMGRDDFEYEFYVVQDDSFNAFALPGGKVFVHSGLILSTNSKAELAGIMGHEIAHAVLSHGFQRITQAGLLSNIGAVIPFGNLVSTLALLDYSRQNERQSDILGTRALANAGYAADGIRNAFATLAEMQGTRSPEYLSTHPAPETRIRYLEELIERNGYNRYAFEGVVEHAEIQRRLRGEV